MPQPSPTTVSNLLAALPQPETGEDFQTLLDHGGVHIERIVSSPRPEPTRYDQPHAEWVLLLQGQATLDVAGEPIHLGPGDHLLIPAHCPHRVLSTSDTPRCVWLAVHINAGGPAANTPPEP